MRWTREFFDKAIAFLEDHCRKVSAVSAVMHVNAECTPIHIYNKGFA